ncbi:hypothetical protein ACHFCA_16405 [Delftia tsuruhatensis]
MQLLSQTHGTPRKMRSGGAVHGPGTGTSDSIPALLSDGEYVLPADTVQAVGRPALDALRSLTHMPVQKFADGGLVDNPYGAVTRTGNSYSGMDVRGNITVNGSAPSGTYTENPGGRAAAAMSSLPAAAPAPAPAPAPVSSPAVSTGGSPTPAAQTGAPAPATMGWAERNAMRNNAVTASSMLASPARDAARAALVTGAAGQTPGQGASPGVQSPLPGAPGSAASQLSTLPGMRRPTVQPLAGVPQYADGGLVDQEAIRKAQASAALVAQIPTGGQLPAPAPDGSQSNPLNNEIGRNAMNTLAALPGAAGLGVRAGGAAARGAASTGSALSTERVIPAAWEVVQDGGAVARAAQEGGTLSRAASTAMQQPAISGNAAQLLSAPPSRALAERTTTAVGEVAPQFARRASGPVPWADVVEPAALAAQQASPAASAASNLAGANLGRAVGVGAGLGGAVVAGTALDANSGGAGASAAGPRPSEPGAPGERVIPPGSGAAQALSSVPDAVGGANVTRVGNSYSGPANIAGDITINGQAPRSAAQMLSSMPAGQISAQNMAAADALAQREQAASWHGLGSEQARPSQAGLARSASPPATATCGPVRQSSSGVTQRCPPAPFIDLLRHVGRLRFRPWTCRICSRCETKESWASHSCKGAMPLAGLSWPTPARRGARCWRTRAPWSARRCSRQGLCRPPNFGRRQRAERPRTATAGARQEAWRPSRAARPTSRTARRASSRSRTPPM